MSTEISTEISTKIIEEKHPSVTKKRKRKRGQKYCFTKKKAKVETPQLLKTSVDRCCLCHEGPKETYGKFFQNQEYGLGIHQYCLFFSSGLPQDGEDHEGFDGFLLPDVVKEANRASKIECAVCGDMGASTGCSIRSCHLSFHYRCGLKEGAQFKFIDAFDCYCTYHREYQDLRLLKAYKSYCNICLETFNKRDLQIVDQVLKPSCCRNVFLHRACVQRQADTSGYYFRCPTCNNAESFIEEMSTFGIFIPQRDAAWEEKNAFAEIYEQYEKCDYHRCKCKRGNDYTTKTGNWNLLKCYLCGQSAIHVSCLGSHYIPGIGYVCKDCDSVAKISKKPIKTTQSNIQSRLSEHKRMLHELKARDDPVLLSSLVHAIPIYKKKYNIMKCSVVVEQLSGFCFKPNSKRLVTYPYLLENVRKPKKKKIDARVRKKIRHAMLSSSNLVKKQKKDIPLVKTEPLTFSNKVISVNSDFLASRPELISVVTDTPVSSILSDSLKESPIKCNNDMQINIDNAETCFSSNDKCESEFLSAFENGVALKDITFKENMNSGSSKHLFHQAIQNEYPEKKNIKMELSPRKAFSYSTRSKEIPYGYKKTTLRSYPVSESISKIFCTNVGLHSQTRSPKSKEDLSKKENLQNYIDNNDYAVYTRKYSEQQELVKIKEDIPYEVKVENI